MDVILVMFKADGTRRDFPVTKSRVVVGRTNTCDLRIPLTSVSRQHCEIRIEGSVVKLRDLGSSNGTYHNNTRVQEATLKAGDEVVVGPVVFTLVVDGQPSAIQPVRTVVAGRQRRETPAGSVPKELPVRESDELPEAVEAEAHTPTVDLDDPIAALEAMAQSEDDDDKPLFDDDDKDAKH